MVRLTSDAGDHEECAYGQALILRDEQRLPVAAIYLGHPNALKHVHLMAAAPQLLEALEAICGELDDEAFYDALVIAKHPGRSAITAAKGKRDD